MGAEKSNHAPSATTQPGPEEEPSTQTLQDVLALVIMWSAREPRRVGEVASFRPKGRSGFWAAGRPMKSTASRDLSRAVLAYLHSIGIALPL